MKKHVFIQSSEGIPVCEWIASAYYGFSNKGYRITLFSDIETIEYSIDNIIIADIFSSQSYLFSNGITNIDTLNIPFEIESFCKRKIWRIKLKEYIKTTKEYNFPLFIKPNDFSKKFEATIFNTKNESLDFLEILDDDSELFLSEVVSFISEYRAYIIDHKLVGLYWYSGDFKDFPDIHVIQNAINLYTTQPIGYSMDFGITIKKKTILIECNDGYSLGNYGLESNMYSELLEKRWNEIIQTKRI